MPPNFVFEATFPIWKDSFNETIDANATPLALLGLLTRTTKETDALIGGALHTMMDFSPVEKVLAEAPSATRVEEIGKMLAFLNTRKFTGVVNASAELPGLQKKEIGEIGQFIRLHCVRKLLARAGVYLNYGNTFKENKKMMEGKIQVITNYPGWQCVKKGTASEKTLPRTLMEFTGSYSVSMEKKIESYLGSAFDLKPLHAMIARAPQGKTAGDLEKLGHFMGSSDFTQTIHQVAHAGKGGKDAEAWLRIYANRKLFEPLKQSALYSQIDIPGLKRLLKKK
ncbi:MAG: hypothetical protein AABY11_02240 [archaeon]